MLTFTWSSWRGRRHPVDPRRCWRPTRTSRPGWTNPSWRLWREAGFFVSPTAAEHKRTSTVVVRLTWFLDCDVDVEEDLNGVRDQCSPPVNDEHDDAAEKCAQQGEPHVVIFICWSPAWYKKDTGNISKHSSNRQYKPHNLWTLKKGTSPQCFIMSMYLHLKWIAR